LRIWLQSLYFRGKSAVQPGAGAVSLSIADLFVVLYEGGQVTPTPRC
jgi:hypothetical protein